MALLLLICLVKKVIEDGGIKFKKKEVIEDDDFGDDAEDDVEDDSEDVVKEDKSIE